MATSIRIRVAGVEGATLDEAAEALGGTVEHLNGGDYLELVIDMDPESRRRSRGGSPCPRGLPSPAWERLMPCPGRSPTGWTSCPRPSA